MLGRRIGDEIGTSVVDERKMIDLDDGRDTWLADAVRTWIEGLIVG